MKKIKISFNQAIVFYIVYAFLSFIFSVVLPLFLGDISSSDSLPGMGVLLILPLVLIGYGSIGIVFLSIRKSRGLTQIIIPLNKFYLLTWFQFVFIFFVGASLILEYLLIYFILLFIFVIDVLRISAKESL